MKEKNDRYLNVDDLVVRTMDAGGRLMNEAGRIVEIDSGQAFKLEDGKWWPKDNLVFLCHDYSNAEKPGDALIAGLPAILARMTKRDEYKDRKIKELEDRIKRLEESQKKP